MCDIIEFLWQKVYQYGLYVRQNKLDGLESWKKVKIIFQKYNKSGEWLPESIERYTEMMSKFSIVDEENNKSWPPEKKQEWEITHFFFQHARIPGSPEVGKNEPNLVRLMQIAYNAGQLEAEKNNKYYVLEWKEYYKKNHLNSYISYMTPHSLIKMSSDLSEDHPAFKEINDIKNSLVIPVQGGGNIYKQKMQKYIKKIEKL